jgi:hypothetical protein
MAEVAYAETLQWKQKVEGNVDLTISPCLYLFGVGLEKDLADATTASSMLQMALHAKTKEHTTLQSVVSAVCDALETLEGRQSGSSL